MWLEVGRERKRQNLLFKNSSYLCRCEDKVSTIILIDFLNLSEI